MVQEKITKSSPTKTSLSQILKKVGILFTVEEASLILKLTKDSTSKVLARWCTQGWLAHVKRGLYAKLPLEVESSDKLILEDPWILVNKLYNASYIGGWTAAEYWGLTEQIFNDICVFSNKYPQLKRENLTRINFIIYPVKEELQFGLRALWRHGVKVIISDPSRTIIDMLNDSRVGGGIEHVIDCFRNYVTSEHFNVNLLVEYAKELDNGAVFKRLGYLSEVVLGKNHQLLSLCKKMLTKGKAQLEPTLKSQKLITKWQLFVPDKFLFERKNDNT